MNHQQVFFELLKEKIPSHLSFVEEISTLLNVGDDSVYRRLRGDKELSFSELQILATHFNISLDSIFSLNSNNLVMFKDHQINRESFSFEQYLKEITQTFIEFNKLTGTELIYSAKDFPVFHYFQFPKLASFKLFFWQKSILDFDCFKNKQFSNQIVFDEIASGKSAMIQYYQIPVKEIWSEEIIHSTLRQIEFYYESEFFENQEVIAEIYEELEQMLIHLQNMATEGSRYLYNQSNKESGDFQLYFNELILSNNSLLAKNGESKTAYITYNELNYITTSDQSFCNYYYDSLKTLISRSSLISTASEKIRNMFFNKLLKKMNDSKRKIGL
jgi:hypothetical protein